MKRMDWTGAGRAGQLRQICMDLLRPGRSAVEQSQDEQCINSPLLASLIDRIGAAGRCMVLDLGPAFGSNVAFFGELHCKLQIADCGTALVELNVRGETPPEIYAAEMENLLPLNGVSSFDAILVWDLLNYLDKPLFSALMSHLSPVVSGDTWLHGYIGSRREMPPLPQRYRLDQGGRVLVTATASGTRSCPCYSQPELRMLMPRFGVSRATLLQNGMQEYLFRGQGRGHRDAVR